MASGDLHLLIGLQNRFSETPPRAGELCRAIEETLEADLERLEATVLLGPRQAGKTTVVKRLVRRRIRQGHPSGSMLYLNLDEPLLVAVLRDTVAFVQLVESYRPSEGALTVFLDEVQRVPDCGLVLKRVQDLGLPVKIVATGSASLQIRERVKESLTGRKQVRLLRTLSLPEVAGRAAPPSPVSPGEAESLDAVHGGHLRSRLERLLVLGGYPAVFLERDHRTALERLSELYGSYLRRDVRDLMNVGNVDGFNRLVGLLAASPGAMLNVAELARLGRIDEHTAADYLKLLELSYVVRRVRPFVGNAATEVVRARRAYFWDTGLRNFAVGRLQDAATHPDRGALLENQVLWMLEDRLPSGREVRFWRTKSKAEVDFVVTGGDGPLPIEVKSGPARRPTVARAFRSFVRRYRPRYGLIVTGDGWHQVDVDGCSVRFVPARWLPFLALPGL